MTQTKGVLQHATDTRIHAWARGADDRRAEVSDVRALVGEEVWRLAEHEAARLAQAKAAKTGPGEARDAAAR